MDRPIILFTIGAIVAIGLFAGGAGILTGATLFNRPDCAGPEYGDVIVRPTGNVACDIVYAEHVNMLNSQAYVNQERGDNLAAQTEQAQWETTQSKMVTWGFVAFMACILGFIVLGMARG